MHALLALLAAASVVGAPPHERAGAVAHEVAARYGFAVSDVSSTGAVASIRIHGAGPTPARSVSTERGVHFTVCGVVESRCARRASRQPALVRRQALELALRTFAETRARLVTVFVPDVGGPRLVLFERRRLARDVRPARLLAALRSRSPQAAARTPVALAVERLTRKRTFALGGLVTDGAEDHLLALPLFAGR